MVKRGGIEDDMRMDMSPVHMGAADKSVTAFGQLHGKFIADPIGRGWVNLPRFEALPQMIGDHVMFAITPARYGGIVAFGKEKFLADADRITFICGYPFTAVSLVGVFHIVRTPPQRGGNTFSRADWKQCCGCQ